MKPQQMTSDEMVALLPDPQAFHSFAGVMKFIQTVVDARDKQWEPLAEEKARLSTEVETLKADAERIDWIASEAKSSYTGVSVGFTKYSEDGQVQEHGFRVMSHHRIGEFIPDIRKSIDWFRKNKP